MTIGEMSDAALTVVRTHHAWAGPICFGLAFLESLAFVSLLVPSAILLIAIGGLVPLSSISFTEIWIGAAVGAALGDWLSYWLGHRFGHRISTLWPFTRYPEMLPRTHRFFERWGALGVFLGRFLGPLRATVPLVAGMGAMPFWPFQIANMTSALLWSAGLMVPGAFGVAWMRQVFG
ncbi:DedA family protein [Lichenihabitans sp. Uapishka_5]|uniref:DedA family protein n=1 Tax=Lichenihabitans sp. Uapishka_5 TaxID=3037302 RepID=UPI0029E7EFE1|nr:DedA family protein [Lichenihabitans sp. Uapishka_5]MDX7953232.1 DedA family protein [Lichenihabitans sp. Uapishka_5]